MEHTPTPSYSFIIKLEIKNKPGMFAKVANVIGTKGGDLRNIEIEKIEKESIVRKIYINTINEKHSK